MKRTSGRQFPAVETMLSEAATGVCAFTAFPIAHWKKVWSTIALERVKKEIKRRTNVVGIFPKKPGRCDWPDRWPAAAPPAPVLNRAKRQPRPALPD